MHADDGDGDDDGDDDDDDDSVDDDEDDISKHLRGLGGAPSSPPHLALPTEQLCLWKHENLLSIDISPDD